MAFNADFIFHNEGAYANEKVLFELNATNGLVVDSTFLQIDGDVAKEELDLSNYVVQSISKIQWSFSDGNFYNTEKVIHIFKESKTEQVSLKVWSEAFVYQGKTFYFTHTVTKDIGIQSRFYKFIKDHYPIYDEVSSAEIDDLIKAAGKFFDRMHADIGSLKNLIDIHKIPAEYLEYWALTLGHTDYVKKVGYDLTTNDLDDYDIFDRIKLNKATKLEVDTLRNFLLYSAELFQNKGTTENIKQFLKFFGIQSHIKELWTKSWGVTLKDSISEAFTGYENFEENKLKLKWKDINVANFDNTKSVFHKNFNSITLNSYNYSQNIEYPLNVVNTVSASGDKYGWSEFELTNNFGLTASPSIIKSVSKEDGSPLLSVDVDDSSIHYDVVPNSPVRYDQDNYSVLQINTDKLNQGDRLSVLYDLPFDGKKDCLVSSTTEKVKNFDFRVTFKLKQENKRTNLYRAPDNELFVVFRGNKSGFNFNTDYDDFYRFSLNTDRSTFSLSKVVYSNNINDYLTQHISLSFNNDEVYEPIIVYPETSSISASEVFVFEKEKEYELLLMVNGNSLSSFVRERRNTNSVKEDISNFDGSNSIVVTEDTEWTPLVENFSFNVTPKKVKTIDTYGNEIYSETYTILENEGYYGFGVKDGIVEFTEITLNNLDEDKKLYNKVEKELELKPEHLEKVPYYETRLDNYEGTKKNFLKTLSDDFKVNTTYEVTEEESSSIGKLFVDKAPVDQSLGTRLTIDFNPSWIESNFTSTDDLISKVFLPIGSQTGWVVPEQRIVSKENYSSINLASGGPGFFTIDKTPILGSYYLEPLDEFSSVTRENIDSQQLFFNDRLNEYISFNANEFSLDGVWEEVYPNSNVFDEISPDIVLDDSSLFSNKMFSPITVEIPEGTRVIGVKFKDCDYIKALINHYSTEFNKEVTIWGSFTFHVPCNTTLYRPTNTLNNNKYELLESNKFPSHKMITVFVPLGILTESILNYSLGREFIQQSSNSPSLIELNGIFSKLSTEKIQVGTDSITIKTPNTFESVEKGLMVKHYISAKLNLTSNIIKPTSLDENKFSSIFTINENTRQFLDSLKKKEESFLWWAPSEVWRKRDFEIQQINLEDDIVSGLNYSDEENNNSKLFYGKQINTSSENIKSLTVKLTDGPLTPNTMYYAKVKIKINYSGFNSTDLDVLSEPEKTNLKVGGQNYGSDLRVAPVKVCKEIYLPLAWYDINDVLVDNPKYDKCSTDPSLSAAIVVSDTLEYANFIRKSFNGQETITFSPLSVMTSAINEKPVSNVNILLNSEELAQYVAASSWDYNKWNKYFIENLEIVEVVERVPSDNYSLFNKYIVMAKNKLNIGSNLEFVYNSAELEWDVLDNFSYFITNHVNEDLVFDVPPQLSNILDWNSNIKDVFINRYVIDPSLYTVGEGVITVATNDILEKMAGGNLVGVFDFDFYFDRERKYKTVEDDFNTTRQINWIPYEANSNEIYENMKRIPSKNLLLGLDQNNTNSHEIIVKENIYAFKSLNKNSIFPYEGRQSGTRVNNRSINITQNEPNARRIFMIDNDNYIFDIKADVYFDSKLNEIKNYRGKKFEIILKASETFDADVGKNILDSYYFAGIGSYDFDAAIGVSQYNKETKKNESSFLAGFGDYNTKNIQSNVWYTIRCIVTNDYIRILLNEKDAPERLIMNYFINPKYQQDTSRYLSGNFEELVYNVTGLDKLNIIYPDKAGENTNEKFVRRFINNELIPKVRPTGSLCGFRIYNEYTYMTNIHYKYLSEDGYQVGKAFDISNLSDMILDINKKY